MTQASNRQAYVQGKECRRCTRQAIDRPMCGPMKPGWAHKQVQVCGWITCQDWSFTTLSRVGTSSGQPVKRPVAKTWKNGVRSESQERGNTTQVTHTCSMVQVYEFYKLLANQISLLNAENLDLLVCPGLQWDPNGLLLHPVRRVHWVGQGWEKLKHLQTIIMSYT